MTAKDGVNPRSPAMSKEEKNRRQREKRIPTGKVGGRPMGEARRIAIETGQARYFTGQPCKQGHVCERGSIDGHCLECNRSRARERYRSKNPPIKYPRVPKKTLAEKRAIQRAYRQTHVEENRRRNALRRAKNPEKHRKRERERGQKISDLIAVLRAENPELLKEFGL